MQIRLNDLRAAAGFLKMMSTFTGKQDQQRYMRVSTREGGVDVVAAGELGVAQIGLPADVIEPGDALVRADMLVGILALVLDERVMLHSDARGCKIRAASGTYRVPVAADASWMYPVLQPADYAVKLPARPFLDAVEFAAAAMGVNDVRHYLNGVFIEVQADGAMNAVGTDGHRLHRASINGSAAQALPSFIIPGRAADKLVSTMEADADLLVWMEGGSYCIRDCLGFTFMGRCIEGQYPDWRKAVPAGGIEVEMPTENLLAALERARVVSAGAQAGGVQLNVAPTSMAVAFDAPGGALDETLECEAAGSAATVLNPEYAFAALWAFRARARKLYFATKGDRPFRIESYDGERTAIIMPVRV